MIANSDPTAALLLSKATKSFSGSLYKCNSLWFLHEAWQPSLEASAISFLFRYFHLFPTTSFFRLCSGYIFNIFCQTKNANAATYLSLHMHFLVTMPCSGCSQVNPMHVLFHCDMMTQLVVYLIQTHITIAGMKIKTRIRFSLGFSVIIL